MLLPELSGFLERLGGGEYKGLIIASFTFTAMISRPFSGKLADKLGRVPVIMAGSVVCFVCSLIYPSVATVSAFLLLRMVHGFSTGFTPTGTAAYMSDVIPAERRGEAMGMLGMFGSLGMAAGPAVGGMLANRISVDALFYCASFCGLVSILILLGIRETLSTRQHFRLSMLKVNRYDLFEPRVLAPCIVMVCLGFSYGTIFTLIPDFGEEVEIRNKGLLFTYMTVAALLIRLIGGRASDRWGRKPVLRVAAVFVAFAMSIIAFAASPLQLIIGMSLYGLAHGTTSPTLIAWATDLSDPAHKGRGVASVYIFMELGIGTGALASGIIYSDNPMNFFYAFGLCALLAIVAFTFLLWPQKPKVRTEAS